MTNNKLKRLSLRQSTAFLLYFGLFCMLFSSVATETGTQYLGNLLLYAMGLIAMYLVFSWTMGRAFKHRVSRLLNDDQFLDRVSIGLLVFSVIIVIVHFIWLRGIPVIQGALNNDYYDIMRIRQAIFFEAPVFHRYMPNLLLKSVLPFLILYFYIGKRPLLFWLTLIVATLYGTALMNKVFVVIPIAPLCAYLILKRHFFLFVKVLVLPVCLLASLVFVQNPQIRPTFWTPEGKATAAGKPLIVERTIGAKRYRGNDSIAENKVEAALFPAFQFVETIYLRIYVIPGQVVSAWFNDIPEKLPFANGCGYRWAAALKGCDFLFFPQLVHDIENPVLVKEGIHGTMTAGSFMEDYANFGKLGLLIGGVLMGFFLALIGKIYSEKWQAALIFNFIPIAMLIELPLTTVLLTGGWALTTFLYFIFQSRLAQLGSHE